MSLDIIGGDILQRIYEILSFLDKLSLVEAFSSSNSYSNIFLGFKPLVIFAATFPVPGLEGLCIATGISYSYGPFDWGYDMERRKNWVSIYHLDRVLNLPIPIDLVFVVRCYGRNELFQKISPSLNLKNVTSLSYEFHSLGPLLSNRHRRTPYIWSDIKGFGNERYTPRLSSLKIDNCFDREVNIPKEFDLDVLLLERPWHISQLPHVVRELIIRSPFLKPTRGDFVPPKGIISLEINFSGPYSDYEFKITTKIIMANTDSLKDIVFKVSYTEPRNVDLLIEHLLDAPKLEKITTNCPFNVEFLKRSCEDTGNSWELIETNWSDECEILSYTWKKQFQPSVVKIGRGAESVYPWDCDLSDLIDCSPCLKAIDTGKADSKFPDKFPPSIKTICWRCSKGPVGFVDCQCLHTLKLTNVSLHEVRNLPSSLKRLVGRIKMFHLNTSMNMDHILNQVPNLNYLCIKETDVPITSKLSSQLVEFSLNRNRKIEPCSMLDCTCKRMLNHFYEGKSIFNIGPTGFSAVSGSNIRYLCLKYPVPSNKNQPIALPLSLEELVFVDHTPGGSYLKFPKNCNTNVRCIHFIVSESYSFYNIGHGREGTYHTRLQYIVSNISPRVDGLRITNSDYFNDSNCPPNLLQIHYIDKYYLNPQHYSRRQRRSIRFFKRSL